MPIAQVLVDVQAQLRRLDRDLDRPTTQRDAGIAALQDVVVVRRDRIGLRAFGDVLAEVREQDAESLGVELVRRRDRVLHVFAGHEPTHGSLGKRQLGKMLPQPRVARHPQEPAAHRSHRRIVPPAVPIGEGAVRHHVVFGLDNPIMGR